MVSIVDICNLGALDYIAQELARTGKASTHTDMYPFGAFLTTILSQGRGVLGFGRLPLSTTTSHSLSRKPMVSRSVQTCELQSMGIEWLPLEECLVIERKYLGMHIGSQWTRL
ncbi:hypothetical protein IFM89_014553 [Coptis chinensis]|uniref:Uncharacterized protein n=1 Tax=Coptis chinensis TaxID=261450 RepID=A0A835H6A6_9MAGN|nr:hypothetical protein IFM89_014553 [Coptis chinensis]